ncbi:MAG: heparinase II/III-family protein, partial [Ignavibacteriaceae bacterium]|nr:heparinase II/III-family protein [Ignavibacteriaceae bacterium]
MCIRDRSFFRREAETAFYGGKKQDVPLYFNEIRGGTGIIKENFSRIVNISSLKSKLENPSYSNSVLEELNKLASDILENKYKIPGDVKIQEQGEINWHIDPVTKYEYPAGISWSSIVFDRKNSSDPYRLWYLARLQQLPILAIAYITFNNESYLKKFYEILDSFLSNNAFCTGINWFMPYEVAIRFLNILTGFAILSTHSRSLLEDNQRYINTLNEHLSFVISNLTADSTNERFIVIEYLALLFSSFLLIDGSFGKELNVEAKYKLEKFMQKSVSNEGFAFSGSTDLQIISTDTLNIAKNLCERNNQSFSKSYNEKLEKMHSVIDEFRMNNGEIPNFGDKIPVKVLPLAGLYSNYAEQTLTRYFNSNQVTLNSFFDKILVNESNLHENVTSPKSSISFDNAGIQIFRGGGFEIFIKSGDAGSKGHGTGSHSDTFSFELFYKSHPVFVDSGTFSFYQDFEMRDKLRSIFSHNTFYVDDSRPIEFDGLFSLKSDYTKPQVSEKNFGRVEDFFEARHFAYIRFQDPLICKRKFYLNKNEKYFTISDNFTAGAFHKIISNLNIHPGVKVEKLDKSKFKLTGKVFTAELDFLISQGNYASVITDSFYSRDYLILEKTKKISFIIEGILPISYDIIIKFSN